MSRKKFKNKYRIESVRLQNWDYGWNGAYHITIKTKNNYHFFGSIIEKKMVLSEIGKLAKKYWFEITNHFPYTILDEMIIMPDHVHLLIWINNPNNKIKKTDVMDNDIVIDNDNDIVMDRHKACLVSNNDVVSNNDQTSEKILKKTIGQKRFQNQGKHTVSAIIGSYKSVITKNSRKINPKFGWQPLFYDQLIRDEHSLKRVRKYIINNPKNWNK